MDLVRTINNPQPPIPMNDDDANQEMRDLFAQAVDYSNMALKQLLLDPSLEKIPEIDMMSKFVNLVAQITQENPYAYMRLGYSQEFIVHYLFPNLSDAERKVIVTLSLVTESILLERANNRESENSSIENLSQWRDNYMKLEKFETKLTALQLALVDSMFCNPDSNIEYD